MTRTQSPEAAASSPLRGSQPDPCEARDQASPRVGYQFEDDAFKPVRLVLAENAYVSQGQSMVVVSREVMEAIARTVIAEGRGQ